MNVTQIKRGRIHQDAIAFFGAHLETPQRRFSECVFHGPPLIGVIAVSAECVVLSDQQNARTRAFEAHDIGLTKLPSIQTNVIRADASGQRFDIKKFRIPLIDLEPNLSRLRVPVERKVSGKLLHAGDFFRDSRQLSVGG